MHAKLQVINDIEKTIGNIFVEASNIQSTLEELAWEAPLKGVSQNILEELSLKTPSKELSEGPPKTVLQRTLEELS